MYNTRVVLVSYLGFQVWDLGSMVYGLGFRVQDLGLRVEGVPGVG